MRDFACPLVLAFAFPLAQASADVITVDDDGAADHATISAAVAAALDGDVVLIRPGTYVEAAPLQLGAKSLTLLGSDGGSSSAARIETLLSVTDLAAGGRIHVQNLQLSGGVATGGAEVLRCDGQVTFDQCSIYGDSGHGSHDDGRTGILIDDSAAVLLSNCNISGGSGIDSDIWPAPVGRGGNGVDVRGASTVALQGGYVFGGFGGNAWPGDPYSWGKGGRGGDGIALQSGTVWLDSAPIEAGGGGYGGSGGDGGTGAVLDGGDLMLVGQSFVTGGWGAPGDDPQFGFDGSPGAGYDFGGGTVTDLGGVFRYFDVPAVLREGESGSVQMTAAAGELSLLLFSFDRGLAPFSEFDGVLGLDPTALVPLQLGSGATPFVAPTLPAGVESLSIHMQPAFVGAGSVGLGLSGTLVVIDDTL